MSQHSPPATPTQAKSKINIPTIVPNRSCVDARVVGMGDGAGLVSAACTVLMHIAEINPSLTTMPIPLLILILIPVPIPIPVPNLILIPQWPTALAGAGVGMSALARAFVRASVLIIVHTGICGLAGGCSCSCSWA
mmetsp:Transcript_29226/g.78456  ORF Transcript_29226/g.78456 Transcript_29226/m.78456 type:complete len:136 (+) Transcript_29226:219-626(+)